MNRTLACLLLAAGYIIVRPHVEAVLPAVRPSSAPVADIGAIAKKMTRADRDTMFKAYDIFSKAVLADPAEEPSFPDMASLRRAHRAMLLVVWRGVLGNEPGKYPGLKEAVEGAFDQRIGSDELLLNPSLKQSAAKGLADIAASFQ